MSSPMAALSATVEARYWAQVAKGGPDECWLWTGGTVGRYGVIHVAYDSNHKKVVAKAHRLGWELANGRSPGVLLVRHRCDNPPCQNPRHLEIGTQADNMRDRKDRGRYVGLQGSRHGMAKITEQDVRAIRALRKEGHTPTEIAECLDIALHIVGDVATRRSWKHVKDVA